MLTRNLEIGIYMLTAIQNRGSSMTKNYKMILSKKRLQRVCNYCCKTLWVQFFGDLFMKFLWYIILNKRLQDICSMVNLWLDSCLYFPCKPRFSKYTLNTRIQIVRRKSKSILSSLSLMFPYAYFLKTMGLPSLPTINHLSCHRASSLRMDTWSLCMSS